jgi:predicted aspartyl protease
MTFPFDAHYGLIVVPTRLTGPRGSTVVRLALDTGATTMMINWEPLVLIGYDPAVVANRDEVATASGVEFSPRISLSKVEALGRIQQDIDTLCHTLPPSTTVDGLLGLNFFRGCRLAIDFRQGEISVD